MLLYLIRHGEAENRISSDDARELTEHGSKITRAMARLLHDKGFERPDLVIASPLVRAQQTAEIVREEFAKKADFETSTALRPESEIASVMALVASRQESHHAVMLVGHDPLFSVLASAIASGGASHGPIEMKKSAVALFELTRIESPRMRGVLKAYLPPRLVKGD